MPTRYPNLKGVRVIDAVNTAYAQGYTNQALIGLRLMPPVAVGSYGGQIIEFDKNAFQVYNSIRSPGANTKRIETSYSGRPFALKLDALEHPIPWEYLNDSAMIGINWANFGVSACMEGLSLNLEQEIAIKLTTAANYATGNTETLSGTSQIDNASTVTNVIHLVDDGKEVVRQTIGREPNVMWVSQTVATRLRRDPNVLAQLYPTSSPQGGTPTVSSEALAQVFGVERVYIGGASKENNDGSFSDLWGKDMGLIYVPLSALDLTTPVPYTASQNISRVEPSLGYTYVYQGHPISQPMYQEENRRSNIYGADYHRDPVFTGVDDAGKAIAGYLWKNVIA